MTFPDIDSLTREEAELIAALVLRQVARNSFKIHRSIETATREACLMRHLALKLEGFAR